MSMPPVPRCLREIDASVAGLRARAAAAIGVAQGLRGCGLGAPDRLTVLVLVLAEEVVQTARAEETAAVEYLSAVLGLLVGDRIGEAAGLAAMPPRGQA